MEGDEVMNYIKPAEGPITSFMDTGRNHPVIGEIRPHQGIDIGYADDNRVWAAAAGVAYNIGYSRDVGNFVLIQHPNGQCTSYSHLASVSIKQGQRVKQGEVIGVKGATGRLVTGVHLHFEISKSRWTNSYSNKLNPLLHFVDSMTKHVQEWLQELGYDTEPDGIYGEKTITAVALYQKRNGLTVDGKAGRDTYAHLKAASAQQVASDAPVKKEEEGNRVWIELSSPTLEKELIKFLESKGQQEIAVKQGVDQGFSESWLTNEKATPGDKATLGLLGMIREKK